MYIALKLVEFEANRNHEILNIMVVEEPEAHIHTHIQRTLFDNLKVIKRLFPKLVDINVQQFVHQEL